MSFLRKIAEVPVRRPDSSKSWSQVRRRLHAAMASAVGLAVLSCSGGGATVAVRNASGLPLTDVHLIARGTTVAVGNLEPGEKRTVVVCPEGESSLSVRFRVSGSERSASADTYLECYDRYSLEVEVARDWSATVRYPETK